MITITEVENLEQIYHYQMSFHSPYFFSMDYDTWKKSFTDDVDGEGRTLFKELFVKAVYDEKESEVMVNPHNLTKGNQQYIDFMLSGNQVGGCEIHFLDDKTVYLRWIYVNDNITGKGIGTKCMSALKYWLNRREVTRFDTDTALSNVVAQHFYEKNGFTKEGITRSYYRA